MYYLLEHYLILRNEKKLRSNPRMGLIYKNLDRMDNQKYTNIKSDSNHFFNKLEQNEKV
jgi:deoxyribodipyrimidine photolyase-related protein